jgi:ribosomal 50S subunit-recycling heat shock protein
MNIISSYNGFHVIQYCIKNSKLLFMILDKYICQNTDMTPSLAKKVISSGHITVNLKCIKNSAYHVGVIDEIFYSGKKILTLGYP